jgi:hypothetical protein
LIVYGQAGIAQIRLHKNILSKEREKSNKRSQSETGCSAAGEFRGGTKRKKKNAMKNLVREYVCILTG